MRVETLNKQLEERSIEAAKKTEQWEAEKADLQKHVKQLERDLTEEAQKAVRIEGQFQVHEGLQDRLTQVRDETQQKDRQLAELRSDNERLKIQVESLGKLEEKFDTQRLQKDLDNLKKRVGEDWADWKQNYQQLQSLGASFASMVRSLSLSEDEDLPEMDEARSIDSDLNELHSLLGEMNTAQYLRENSTGQLDRRVEELEDRKGKLNIPWDSTFFIYLESLGKRARDGSHVPVPEASPSLVEFAGKRGFKIISPAAGEAFSVARHLVADERADQSIGRRQVIRTLAPGLEKEGKVRVKASIILAK